MASFRTGFKIFGEISLKQGFGRIRSFSEDRKPGQWLPEDQWSVRQPGNTCPDPCEKPKKQPPKPSKSWLSICKDPEQPQIVCDTHHNNCPPPPVKGEGGPWYSLDSLIPKKKQEKPPPPLRTCREEMKRREQCPEEEEVCENLVTKSLTVDIKSEVPERCISKQEPSPAPVVTLSIPLPKELDLMLWCGQPSRDTSRIAAKCQSDKLPYQEFRPQQNWKPPPFSLPIKAEPTFQPACSNSGPVAYAEFKQVEVPKPLFTRYKSVELSDTNFLLSMTNATCPDDLGATSLAITPPSPNPKVPSEVNEEKEKSQSEKPILGVGSSKPVRLKNAPKYTFRPKPTKLIEKRVVKNPCAHHKKCNSPFKPPEENDKNKGATKPHSSKVFTGTLTNEPQIFERNFLTCNKPPSWMYFLCKPGSKETPLVPPCEIYPKEPDWCSETDGLKFYDGNDDTITPKPPPDPYTVEAFHKKLEDDCAKNAPAPKKPIIEQVKEIPNELRSRFVLMPEKYNIRNLRPEGIKKQHKASSLENFIEAKTGIAHKCSKSITAMKENILYDLQRMCPNLPFDPSKINAPCRKPVEPDCPQPPRFYRSFSTFGPAAAFKNLCSFQLYKTQQRTECGDSSGKCKVGKLIPKPKPCPENGNKGSECAEITLPCCPKARIPPDCNYRRPLPPCKKRLAPKPSFSECSRDPPPTPKITECNCWDRKPGPPGGDKKGRKYSDWAAQKNDDDLETEKNNTQCRNEANREDNPVKTEIF